MTIMTSHSTLKTISIFSLIFLLASTRVFAVNPKMQLTGISFLNACTQHNESWISFCNGYIQAVVDSIPSDSDICIPNGTTRTEMVTIAQRGITTSHQLHNINAHEAIRIIFDQLYSCQ